MAHRIRYAMTQEPLFSKLNGTVEVDETYVGGKARNMHKKKRAEKIKGRGASGKAPVVTLVERDGRVQTNTLNMSLPLTCVMYFLNPSNKVLRL